MKLNKPVNSNYCATVIEIKTLVPLDKCDNVQAAIIMGNQVVVSKDVKIGDIGLFFPVETQLSKEYLSNNNLYRKPELNIDSTQKGYFEENGRIRCVKFRGNKSEGLFMPLESLDFIGNIELNLGDDFDKIGETEICKKYISKSRETSVVSKNKRDKNLEKFKSKLIENQFRFHTDTSQLYKNLHNISADNLIHISYKVHGTSGISSYVLCKKYTIRSARVKAWLWNLSERIINPFRKTKYSFKLEGTEYDYIYSSRKVIKNENINPIVQHYYNEDIWGIAHEEIKPFLQKGLTFYYEIVGYLPNGGYIQKDYDYGYTNPLELWDRDFIIKNNGENEYLECYIKGREGKKSFGIYIYRITYTNPDGKVFEFSAKQVQDFCKKNGLNAVPELYYGYAKDIFPSEVIYTSDEDFQNQFLSTIKQLYNEKDCFMCKNQVVEEGCVVRIEGLEIEAYKQKSTRFYELETKLLDKGEVDIESDN